MNVLIHFDDSNSLQSEFTRQIIQLAKKNGHKVEFTSCSHELIDLIQSNSNNYHELLSLPTSTTMFRDLAEAFVKMAKQNGISISKISEEPTFSELPMCPITVYSTIGEKHGSAIAL